MRIQKTVTAGFAGGDCDFSSSCGVENLSLPRLAPCKSMIKIFVVRLVTEMKINRAVRSENSVKRVEINA